MTGDRSIHFMVPMFIIAGALVLYLIVTRPESDPYRHIVTTGPTMTDFARRINEACPKGTSLFDWVTEGDEYNPAPPGTIIVHCVDAKGGLIQVAVPR